MILIKTGASFPLAGEVSCKGEDTSAETETMGRVVENFCNFIGTIGRSGKQMHANAFCFVMTYNEWNTATCNNYCRSRC